MREIKFRAWDKENKVMCDCPAGYNAQHRKEKWVWMQFTGLKDKNGKEIYEGDILSIDAGVPPEIFKAVVVYNLDRFEFDGDNSCYGLQDYVHFAIVIGNIYENPELASGKATA